MSADHASHSKSNYEPLTNGNRGHFQIKEDKLTSCNPTSTAASSLDIKSDLLCDSIPKKESKIYGSKEDPPG
ncbi:hypothetical protein ABKN59_002098 [Abortiporus biennis]